MVKKVSKEVKFYVGLIVALLVTVGSWAIFNLARIGISNFLINQFGITDEVTQLTILVALIIIILVVLGYSFRRAIKQLIR